MSGLVNLPGGVEKRDSLDPSMELENMAEDPGLREYVSIYVRVHKDMMPEA